MGPGLGPRLGLGLESLPPLETLGRPVCSRGLRTLEPSAVVGIAGATSTALGTRRQPDMEPDCQRAGILEHRHLDSDLGKRRVNAQSASG